MSGLPKPIRIDRDRWICMRESQVLPKGLIQRLRVTELATGRSVTKFRLVLFDIVPERRRLVGYFDDLDSANHACRYEVPADTGRTDRSFAEYPKWHQPSTSGGA
jgi:hypothetical protein